MYVIPARSDPASGVVTLALIIKSAYLEGSAGAWGLPVPNAAQAATESQRGAHTVSEMNFMLN